MKTKKNPLIFMQINLVKFLNNLNKYIGFGNSTTLRNLSIFDALGGVDEDTTQSLWLPRF